LIASGAAEIIRPDEFEDQFVLLANDALYDATTGLSWEDPTFRDAATLIL
jgi:hypothetical protein